VRSAEADWRDAGWRILATSGLGLAHAVRSYGVVRGPWSVDRSSWIVVRE